MGACDVLTFPSQPAFGEGFGLAALEGMAAGRPIVATATCSLPEVVVSGESGFLIDPDSSDELAAALVRLAEDRRPAREDGSARAPARPRGCSRWRRWSSARSRSTRSVLTHGDARISVQARRRRVGARPTRADPELWARNSERPNIGADSRRRPPACRGRRRDIGVGHWLLTGDAQASDAVDDSADGLIFWVGCEQDVVTLTDAELDEWKSRGVDGFVCMVEPPAGPGRQPGLHRRPGGGLEPSNYELQRALRDSDVVERAAARGMKMYLGVQPHQLLQPVDTAAGLVRRPRLVDSRCCRSRRRWRAPRSCSASPGSPSTRRCTRRRAARQTATWSWDYPGNTHSEAEVRAQGAPARGRGDGRDPRRLSRAPSSRSIDAFFPGDWRELVQEEVNGLTDTLDRARSTSTSGTG